jgi:hypothetical protein
LDSLLLGQRNINILNQFPTNLYFFNEKSYFLSSVSNLYERHMFLRAQYKKIDP